MQPGETRDWWFCRVVSPRKTAHAATEANARDPWTRRRGHWLESLEPLAYPHRTGKLTGWADRRWFAGRAAGRLAGWLPACLAGWLAGRPAGQLAGGLN